MRLAIRHTTRYGFEHPVVHGLQRLRLTPKTTQGQRIVDWRMDYRGASPQISYEDQNHNTVTLIEVEPGVEEIVIACSGVVETSDLAGVIGRHAGHLPLWSFRAQTPLTEPGEAVTAILHGLERPEEGGLITLLHDLSARILEQVEYQTGQTGVETTGEEAAALGRGVCQDHAHIFLGAARKLDVPARYVSGYLMMNDRVDQEATHAWVEAHVDGLGWVGFDVSNGISPDTRYVRVATGRDYTDATPISGITFGGAQTALDVRLAVEQQTVEQ